MKYEIKDRWDGSVIFTTEIDCDANASESVKRGLAARSALNAGANIARANIAGANFALAYLPGANLAGASLDCPIKIENIHQRIYSAASQPGALDMSEWHKSGDFCGTTHCRAGWVTHLAGDGGRALEWALGTSTAAALIYMASDPTLERVPDFDCDTETAMADMKRLAEMEAERQKQ